MQDLENYWYGINCEYLHVDMHDFEGTKHVNKEEEKGTIKGWEIDSVQR